LTPHRSRSCQRPGSPAPPGLVPNFDMERIFGIGDEQSLHRVQSHLPRRDAWSLRDVRGAATSHRTTAQMAPMHHLPTHFHCQPDRCALLLASVQAACISTEPYHLPRRLMTNQSGCIAAAAGPSRREVSPHILSRLRLQTYIDRLNSYRFQLAAERSRRTPKYVRLSFVRNSLPTPRALKVIFAVLSAPV